MLWGYNNPRNGKWLTFSIERRPLVSQHKAKASWKWWNEQENKDNQTDKNSEENSVVSYCSCALGILWSSSWAQLQKLRFQLLPLIPVACVSLVLECPKKCVVACIFRPSLIHGCPYYTRDLCTDKYKIEYNAPVVRKRFPWDLQPDSAFLLPSYQCEWKRNAIFF